MQYGLIGEKLGHSYSKEIHEAIADYNYEPKELAKDELAGFFGVKDFKAINVTIPYKQDVIQYLDFISDDAKAIGAVNTIVNKDGKLCCSQGVIVGCSGGMYENISVAADILKGGSVGNGYFDLSVYPSSSPVNLALLKDGTAAKLTQAGAVMKPCFCGPCFGAGDTPANNTLSVRHATRNFPNREGSRPSDGQIAAVALMDARSIAATALNHGVITAASDIDYEEKEHPYVYDGSVYDKRCYFGFNDPKPDTQLKLGPNITDWPKMPKMKDDLLVNYCAVIDDPVTTTDELIPSGETSSYRSNPVKLSDFALSRRGPSYASKSKEVRAIAEDLEKGKVFTKLDPVIEKLRIDTNRISVGSCAWQTPRSGRRCRRPAASCRR